MRGSAKASGGILAGLVLMVLWSGSVSAAAPVSTPPTSANAITISPPFKELVLGTGLINATSDITITNHTDKEVDATIRLVDFKALDEFGGITLGQAGKQISKYGLANWMSIPTGSSLSLPSRQAATMTVSVDNRGDLAPGGHYGAVVVTTGSPTSVGNKRVNFKQELVSLLFVKKLGGERYGLELQSLKADKGTSLSDVSLRFRSTGNVQVIPRGYVTVADPAGKIIAKGVINPDSTMVLSDTSRQFVTLMQSISKFQFIRTVQDYCTLSL